MFSLCGRRAIGQSEEGENEGEKGICQDRNTASYCDCKGRVLNPSMEKRK